MSDATVAKKPRETDDVPVPPTLRKSLKNRHIQLIALGGAIGTGLFYGSSESIQLAGPAILLAYLIGGLAIFLIVRALSEMAVEDPKAGAFSYYRHAVLVEASRLYFRLELLVQLRARGHGGVGRGWLVRELLVPEHSEVGVGGGVPGGHRGAESYGREQVRRI